MVVIQVVIYVTSIFRRISVTASEIGSQMYMYCDLMTIKYRSYHVKQFALAQLNHSTCAAYA